MAQQRLKFNDLVIPAPESYEIAFATTSSSNSGRLMRGTMINTPLFTVEAYNLKWVNLSANDISSILAEIMGRSSFSFYHFNVYRNRWETGSFYVANINTPALSLKEGREKVKELSMQVTAINPIM